MTEESFLIIPELNKISKILAGYLLRIYNIFYLSDKQGNKLLNKVSKYSLLQKFDSCRCRPIEIILDIIFFILVSDCALKNTVSVERFIGLYHLLEGVSKTDICSIVSDLFGNKTEVPIAQVTYYICSKTTLLNAFLDYRKYLNDQIFSIFIYKRITDRFKRKADIIQWQLTHDKLPPLSCLEFFQCKLFCLVNPLQYDYPLQDDRTLYEVFVELSKNNYYQMRIITLDNNDNTTNNNNNNNNNSSRTTTTGSSSNNNYYYRGNIRMNKSNNGGGYTKYLMKYANPNYQPQPLSSTANSSSYDSKVNMRISGNVNPMITKLKKVGSVHSLERVSGPLPSMFSSESNSDYRSNNYKHSSLSKVYLN